MKQTAKATTRSRARGHLSPRRFAAAAAALALVSAWAATAVAQEPDPDLVKLGQSLLPSDDPKPAKKPAARRDAGVDAAAAGGATGNTSATADAGSPAATDLDGGATDEADAAVDAAALAAAASRAAEPEDAGPKAEGASTAAAPTSPPAPAAPRAPVAVGPAARKARIASGENLPMEAAEQSPLAAIGVPVAAVPAVATTATVGAVALWPFLVKAVTGLLKAVFGSFLKSRAKRGQKVDRTQRTVTVAGFSIRPFELGSLLAGALVYGLAVCYAFQGRSLSASFLARQELLIVLIYYSRAFIRLVYERAFNLPTQFRFWPGGGVLCLVSAFLGSALGTVGYEIEEAPSPEHAKRIVTMKARLVALAFAMSIVFFVANVLWPSKILQSGRVMMSGMALAEILPFTPMPGKKIREENKILWLVLFVLIVPTFVLINFVL